MTNEWRTIDSAPKDGTPILVCCRSGDITIAMHSDGAWAYCSSLGYDLENYMGMWYEEATHWMPLPSPPRDLPASS